MRKNDQQHNDPWDRDFYETGSTRPPKQHGGIIAFLLMLVILLGGICSALGIVNARLLQELAKGEEEPQTLELFEDEVESVPAGTLAQSKDRLPRLGLIGQTVSDFDRKYYELPKGVLVTDAAEDRSGYRAGIRAGDVIFSVEGQTVATHEELTARLDGCSPGQKIKMEVYRSRTRERFTATVIILDEEAE